MYTVQNGDTLWSIAQKFYNDGDAWPQIQKTNNLTTTDLENGTVLTIPTISNASPSPEVNTSVSSSDASPTGPTGTSPTGPTGSSPTGPTGSSPTGPTGMIEDGPTGATGIELTQQGQTSSASTDRQYTVVEGDSLWDICVNRYNDGYRWVQVAQMNNLQNPNLIFTGTTLLMP